MPAPGCPSTRAPVAKPARRARLTPDSALAACRLSTPARPGPAAANVTIAADPPLLGGRDAVLPHRSPLSSDLHSQTPDTPNAPDTHGIPVLPHVHAPGTPPPAHAPAAHQKAPQPPTRTGLGHQTADPHPPPAATPPETEPAAQHRPTSPLVNSSVGPPKFSDRDALTLRLRDEQGTRCRAERELDQEGCLRSTAVAPSGYQVIHRRVTQPGTAGELPLGHVTEI